MKLHVKKGDKVIVLSGNNKGKTAKVLSVSPKKYSAILEGINLVTRHIKPSADNPKGGIEKKEAPIHLSNLMIVDPSNGKPTKIYRKRNKDGKIERFSKKSNKIIK
jgi:large subunit ribosomal protein L24